MIRFHRPATTGPGIRTPRKAHTELYVFGARVRFEFKLADLWIGAFWQAGETDHMLWARAHHLWICFVPCLPLHITWWRSLGSLDDDDLKGGKNDG